MGIINFIRKRADLRLRKPYLDKLTRAIESEGIQLSKNLLCNEGGISLGSYFGGVALILTNRLMKCSTPNTQHIDIILQPVFERLEICTYWNYYSLFNGRYCWRSIIESPEEAFLVGTTVNPNYQAEIIVHEAELQRLEEEGLVPVVDEKSIRQRFEDELQLKHKDWQNTSLEKWLKNYDEGGKNCPVCNGKGKNVVETGDYLYGLTYNSFPCGNCSGRGYRTLEKFIKDNEPKVDYDSVCLVIGNARDIRNSKIAELQSTNTKLLRPIQECHVYIKISVF